jgi:hypothetical protein
MFVFGASVMVNAQAPEARLVTVDRRLYRLAGRLFRRPRLDLAQGSI